jgi:hypothetical protein
MKKFKNKYLSFLLIIPVLIQSSYFSAGTVITGTVPETNIYKGDIPEVIDEQDFNMKRHTQRLYQKENDLSTFIFKNADGTETAYIFNEPVKYEDEKGNIQNKSNKLYSDFKTDLFDGNYAYVNKDNDIKTYFPTELSAYTGIILEYEGKVIEMYPFGDAKLPANEKEGLVYYNNPFGETTSLRYQPLFSGFREDIILNKYIGNEFRFILETGSLKPVSENGAINLIDPNNNTIFAVISPIFVYDSLQGEARENEAHCTFDNRLDFKPILGGKYEIIMRIDDEFLKNPATVYPIFVDPEITISATGSGANKTILDTPIYNGSGAAGLSAGANGSAVIGYVGTSYGSGRLLMRFPGLMNQSFMNAGHTITAADLKLSDGSGLTAAASIAAYNYTGPAWNESSVYSLSIWNGANSANGSTLINSASFSFPNQTQNVKINILSAVKMWQTDTSAATRGIILKNNTSETNATYYKGIYTSEGSNKPSLTVTYQNSEGGLPSTMSAGKIISLTGDRPALVKGSYSMNNSSAGYIKVSSSVSQYISIYTTYYSSYSLDTIIEVYTSTSATTYLARNDDSNAPNLNACICFYANANQTYYIKIYGFGTSQSGMFNLIVHRGYPTSGSERPDMFSIYNSSAYEERTNCYVYALSYYINPITQANLPYPRAFDPGGFVKFPSNPFYAIQTDYPNAYKSAANFKTAFANCAALDFNYFGGLIEEISPTQQPKPGYFKIALIIRRTGKFDYHFYRQLPDGSWVHKQGIDSATDKDKSSKYIYQPEFCNWGDYTNFVAFYQIKIS